MPAAAHTPGRIKTQCVTAAGIVLLFFADYQGCKPNHNTPLLKNKLTK